MNNVSRLVVFVCIMLSGCSWLSLEEYRSEYLQAKETQIIVVPENMSALRLGQLYSIPKVSGDISLQSTAEVPRPQPISANTFEQLVKIQRIDEKRWILVNNSPSELWPRVRHILNRNGIVSIKANGSAGVIETAWLSYNSDQENEHRFRLTITPGVQLNSTEISVLHQIKPLVDESQIDWPEVSQSDEKEKEMITFLANQLVAQPDYASVSLLAQDIGGESKVVVINPEVADPYILVKLSYDRTWASVNYSASRGGFSLIDQDSDQGLLLVNYSDDITKENSTYIFGWLGSKENDDILEANYRVLVQEVESSVEIRIVSLEGNSLGKEKTLKLLNIFRSNMS